MSYRAHTSDVISSTEASYRTQTSTSVVHWYDEWPTTLQTIFASVADICITVFMCWYFMNNAREPGLKQTKSLLRTLTVYTINRGLLTTTLQILQAVTFTAYKEVVFYWLLFHFPGSKVYVNSLLALFNARRRLRRVSEPDSSLSLAQNVDSPV
ncbi:hypothetical protein WOLCODRAFT_151055 [Wolfiporia cocos MD-104 SS10]|uniref:DUF6534 domain-containing protein n=1 Tax=Wolfiporia cocos (strain MD-104) TaxID=742152 RepID=A0A2H3JWA9_WOLCO|nr:hypothetical protein WOLCODRAFT_151055 [Wolfiporia cocos MD-104 SS10]